MCLGVWCCLGVSTRGYIPRESFHIQNEEKFFILKRKKSYCSIYMNFWYIKLLDGQFFRCKSLLKSIHSSLTFSIFLYSSLFIQRFFHGSNDLLWTRSSTQYENIFSLENQRASESKCLFILNKYFNRKWWVMSDWFFANKYLNS